MTGHPASTLLVVAFLALVIDAAIVYGIYQLVLWL
jgi:hypothetical protein